MATEVPQCPPRSSSTCYGELATPRLVETVSDPFQRYTEVTEMAKSIERIESLHRAYEIVYNAEFWADFSTSFSCGLDLRKANSASYHLSDFFTRETTSFRAMTVVYNTTPFHRKDSGIHIVRWPVSCRRKSKRIARCVPQWTTRMLQKRESERQ
jgi:hypothetical protein